MRDLLRVLAISGVLAIAAAGSPAIAQTEGHAPTDSSSRAADPARTADSAQTASPAQTANVAQTADPGQTASPAQTANVAQTADPAQTESPTPAPSPAQPGGAAQSASGQSDTPVPDEDQKKALAEIRASWRDYEKCLRSRLCDDYFESFGVGITFNDGTLAPFAHVQRLKTSRHDCIMIARDALDRGDRSMAVQWVMASQMREPLERNWLGDHPDAVLAALRHAVF